MNNSVYEQIFRTQSVSDDALCLELRTRKWGEVQSFVERYHPNKAVASRSINIFNDNVMCHFRNILKRRQKQITMDNFLVGLKQSRVVSRDRKKKKNPFPNDNISLPHHLPLMPSTILHTGTVKLN